MESRDFNKIEQVLTAILSNNRDIYAEENKSIFNAEIRKYCSDNEYVCNILLTLVVNDVFLFINKKDFERAERNVYNCLSDFNFYQDDYRQLFCIFNISSEIKKIHIKQKVKKIRNTLIVFILIGLVILVPVINYKSYFRSENEVFVKAGESSKAFFISKYEEHDADGYPLVGMSWYEVIKYCNDLSKKNNLACVYQIDDAGKVTADFSMPGYRLPTLQEWKWAALGADEKNSILFSGADKNLKSESALYSAWYIENSMEEIHKVGLKKSNSLGIYDMSGNVAEWCWDTTDNDCRIVCGGFYGTSERYLNLLNSIEHKPNFGEIYIGFRVVRSYVKKNVGVEK